MLPFVWGYARWKNPPAQPFHGWFPTSDARWLDADSYLDVEGLLDDVIVRGGENISPGEIEDALRGHPSVADAVVCRDGPGDEVGLCAHVRSRLRSTKNPEIWFFRAELPYSETGKLLRRVLKAELA